MGMDFKNRNEHDRIVQCEELDELINAIDYKDIGLDELQQKQEENKAKLTAQLEKYLDLKYKKKK